MKNIAALVVLVSSYLPANAEVSDDLKFCGDLKSRAERLACYDAAARIASRPATVRPVAARVAPLDAQAASHAKALVFTPAQARNPFDGYYAAIGGGYGVGSGRDGLVAGPLVTGLVTLTSTAGPNVTTVLGRNIAFGWGIVGLELDARWAAEKGTGTVSPLNFPNVGTPLLSYSYKDDAGVHAVIRVGATFDDLLIFAKAGLGATRVTESFTADERNVRQCFSFGPGGCVVLGPPGTLGAVQTSSWLPSAILGVGVEKNWGPVFVRFGADLEAFNHATTSVSATGVRGSSTSTQIMWTTRGTAMIGVRF
jgi:hypothetical protein